jgi:hypothetical protein
MGHVRQKDETIIRYFRNPKHLQQPQIQDLFGLTSAKPYQKVAGGQAFIDSFGPI